MSISQDFHLPGLLVIHLPSPRRCLLSTGRPRQHLILTQITTRTLHPIQTQALDISIPRPSRPSASKSSRPCTTSSVLATLHRGRIPCTARAFKLARNRRSSLGLNTRRCPRLISQAMVRQVAHPLKPLSNNALQIIPGNQSIRSTPFSKRTIIGMCPTRLFFPISLTVAGTLRHTALHTRHGADSRMATRETCVPISWLTRKT
jgi:hypothetical protein